MWIQRLTRSRAFRIFDRTTAMLAVLCFAVGTWLSQPPLLGILAIATACSIVAAAASWYQTRAITVAAPARSRRN